MKKLTAGIFTALVGLCAANSADAAVASKGWVEQEMKENVTETTFTGTNYLNTATGLKDAATKLDAQVKVNADVIATLDSAGGTGEGGGIAGFIENVSKNTTAIETLNADTSNPNSVASKIASALETYTTEKNYLNAQSAADTYQKLDNIYVYNSDTITEAKQSDVLYPSMKAVDTMLAGEVKTLTDGLNAINDAETGIKATLEGELNDMYDDLSGLVEDAQETADAAVVRKTNNINYLVGTDAEGAIKPIIPAECSKPTNYCVLTYGTDAGGNTGYVWEVIERETTTSQG